MVSRILRRILLPMVVVGALAFPASSLSTTKSLRIDIPRINLNVPLSYTTLDYGPEIYYQDFNTLMIAGHRVTHTHPFYYINNLRKGDSVYIIYGTHKNRYIVKRKAIYTPIQAKHLSWYPGLVLSACTPRHFATYRYVVFAKLV